MSNPKKTSDHLKYAAKNMEKVQIHLRGAIRNSPQDDFSEIIKGAEETTADLEKLLREMKLNAKLWEKSEELNEDGVISIDGEDDG